MRPGQAEIFADKVHQQRSVVAGTTYLAAVDRHRYFRHFAPPGRSRVERGFKSGEMRSRDSKYAPTDIDCPSASGPLLPSPRGDVVNICLFFGLPQPFRRHKGQKNAERACNPGNSAFMFRSGRSHLCGIRTIRRIRAFSSAAVMFRMQVQVEGRGSAPSHHYRTDEADAESVEIGEDIMKKAIALVLVALSVASCHANRKGCRYRPPYRGQSSGARAPVTSAARLSARRSAAYPAP